VAPESARRIEQMAIDGGKFEKEDYRLLAALEFRRLDLIRI